MSSAQYNAGQSYAKTQAKTEGLMELAKNTTQSAHDKVCDEINSQAQAQQNKEEKAGFLQHTGEQVVHIAQGATDRVKSTLGVGDKK